MRAMLLAAGFGTRLRPLTNTVPKCLLPIQGKPLLQIWLERLTEAGVRQFLINTHYLAEQVVTYVESSPFRDHVTLVHEPEILGTAGAVIRNAVFFDGDDGLVIHADNYCDADMRDFMRAHAGRPAGCLMTMMTFRTDEPSSCGIVELDDRGVVIGFHEKVQTPPGNVANGAIYILATETVALLKSDLPGASDFSNHVLPRLVGRIYTYHTSQPFADIGSLAAYERLNRTLTSTPAQGTRS